jgi:hypothetical protein
MSIQSVFDEMLEDTECPKCNNVGALPIGGGDYECSNPDCGYTGTIEGF